LFFLTNGRVSVEYCDDELALGVAEVVDVDQLSVLILLLS